MGERWNKRVSVRQLEPQPKRAKGKGMCRMYRGFRWDVSYLLFQTLPESHVLVIQ